VCVFIAGIRYYIHFLPAIYAVEYETSLTVNTSTKFSGRSEYTTEHSVQQSALASSSSGQYGLASENARLR